MSTSVSGVSSHFPSAENGFTTTTSGSVSPGAATVGLNSVAGYANGEIAVFVIDPSLATKQTFTGTIDTAGVQVTGVVWTAGTNSAHSAGATVVDYATATHISMITKGLLVPLDQDGTLKAGAVDNAAALASNVVTNAKVLDSTLELNAKAAPWDGWTAGSGTWTYASATTFTVPAADAAVMQAGTKIKLTQTTAKYFYVVSVSGTTVTVTGGTDYTVANAAITSPFMSNGSTPFGFPGNGFAYTPTWANFTVGSATQTCRFQMQGKVVLFTIAVVLSGSTMGTSPTFTLPVTSATVPDADLPIAHGQFNTGASSYNAFSKWVTTTTSRLFTWDANNNENGLTSTAPGVWADGWKILLQGKYIAA